MKRGASLLLVAVVVIAGLSALTMPPRRTALSPTPDGTLPGNLHIHTTRSDGGRTPDDVAASAARAGLKFIVFTDHGDATRSPDPPTYRSGVLCLDAVEISTAGGHLLALDMPAAPYPLGGEARDVMEDVRRLGGMGVAAHPDSPKPGLRWLDWRVPVDAVEGINPDTSWRVYIVEGWRARLSLANAVLHYPFRAGETLASLLTPHDEAMATWSSLVKERPVAILSGVDAHAKMASKDAAPGDNRFSLPLPSYEAVFETMSAHVRTAQPLTGDAARDGRLVMDAIRAGHLYTAVDGFATQASFELSATDGVSTAREGDALESPVGPVTLTVRSNAPPGYATTVWRGETVVATGGAVLTVQAGSAGAVYRAEVRTGDARTWILSNPIYVGKRPEPPALLPAAVTASAPVKDSRPTGGWHIELDPDTTGTMDTMEGPDGFSARLRYTLSAQTASGRMAALVWGPVTTRFPTLFASYDRVHFKARADRPMRMSVQVRALASDGLPRRRWRRSVYVDSRERDYTVFFADMAASPETSPALPPLDEVNAVMFVVDGVNARLGQPGEVVVSGASLQR